MSAQNCKKINLQEGTKLHEEYFARLSVLHGENFAKNNTNLK